MTLMAKFTTYQPLARTSWRPGEGERGWHTEEGRRKRVRIIREPCWSHADGCELVLCAFVDEQMARFEVPISELEPADATWERAPQLVALRHTRAYLGGSVSAEPLAQRAVAQPLPDNDEPDLSSVRVVRSRLTESQRANLDMAERLGQSSRHGDQAQARGLIRDVFLAVARGELRSDKERRLAELQVLEEGRDGKLAALPSGAVRATGRDGLDTLLEAGTICTVEYDAGMRYRGMFEAAGLDGRIKSIMAASNGRRRMAMTEAEIFADENWMAEVARAKKHIPVENVERHVRNAVQTTHGCSKAAERAVTALRAIAGAGWTLYRLAPSGRRNQQYSSAISEALTLAADYFGMW